MTTNIDLSKVKASSNLTIILRDDDTGAEVRNSINMFVDPDRRFLTKMFLSTLNQLWPVEKPKEAPRG